MGVFPSRDPFEGIHGRPMSLNGYSWVEGNTPNLIDPIGLQVNCAEGYEDDGSGWCQPIGGYESNFTPFFAPGVGTIPNITPPTGPLVAPGVGTGPNISPNVGTPSNWQPYSGPTFSADGTHYIPNYSTNPAGLGLGAAAAYGAAAGVTVYGFTPQILPNGYACSPAAWQIYGTGCGPNVNTLGASLLENPLAVQQWFDTDAICQTGSNTSTFPGAEVQPSIGPPRTNTNTGTSSGNDGSHVFYYSVIGPYPSPGRETAAIESDLNGFTSIPGIVGAIGQLNSANSLATSRPHAPFTDWLMGRKFESERLLEYAGRSRLLAANSTAAEFDMQVTGFGTIQFVEVKWTTGLTRSWGSSQIPPVINKARQHPSRTYLAEFNFVSSQQISELEAGGGEFLSYPYP